MSNTRMFDSDYWSDEWIESLSRTEGYFFIYLFTNQNCNIAGIYQITPKDLASKFKFTLEELKDILQRFEQANKVYYFENHIIIKNFPKYQAVTNARIKTGIENVIRKLNLRIILKLIEIGYCYDIYTIDMNYNEHQKYIAAKKRNPDYKGQEPEKLYLVDFIKLQQQKFLKQKQEYEQLKMIVNGTNGIGQNINLLQESITNQQQSNHVETTKQIPTFNEEPASSPIFEPVISSVEINLQTYIDHWNSCSDPENNTITFERKTAFNFSGDKLNKILDNVKLFTEEEILKSMDTYRFIDESELHELNPAYQSIAGFLEHGISKYVEYKQALKRCEKKLSFQQQQELEEQMEWKKVLEKGN